MVEYPYKIKVKNQTVNKHNAGIPLPPHQCSDLWYFSYGSNLDSQRFNRYLNIGLEPPQVFPLQYIERRLHAVPHRRYFAHECSSWENQGIAFLDPHKTPGVMTTGKVWKLNRLELAAIVAQENDHTDYRHILSFLPVDESTTLRPNNEPYGNYDYILYLGTLDGLPVYTCTSKYTMDEMAAAGYLNPPSQKYIDTIHRGLTE